MWTTPPPVVRYLQMPLAAQHAGLAGVRIVHLSDLHCGGVTPESHIRTAIDLVNQHEPDVVALTGDYVNWHRKEIPIMRDWLSGIKAPVAATLGNHDYFTSAQGVSKALHSMGYEVLRNAHATMTIRGHKIQVVGIDDPITKHHDLEGAFAGVQTDQFRLALCHCPEQVTGIATKGADVVLSGHTHGAQIYLGRVTDRIIRRVGRRYRYGWHAVQSSRLYVTSGVGFSGIRLRFGQGTAAEVVVLDLVHEASVKQSHAAFGQ